MSMSSSPRTFADYFSLISKYYARNLEFESPLLPCDFGVGKLSIFRNVTKELLYLLKVKAFKFFSTEKNDIFFALLLLNFD